MNEKEKKKSYNERILNCDQGSFTPVVFSANGGMGRECKIFYKRLATMLADKRKQPIEIVSSWINRKINFSLMKCVVMCVRGSRSHRTQCGAQMGSNDSDAHCCEKFTSIT